MSAATRSTPSPAPMSSRCRMTSGATSWRRPSGWMRWSRVSEWALGGEPLVLVRYMRPQEVARHVPLPGRSEESRLRAVYAAFAGKKIGYAYAEADAGSALLAPAGSSSLSHGRLSARRRRIGSTSSASSARSSSFSQTAIGTSTACGRRCEPKNTGSVSPASKRLVILLNAAQTSLVGITASVMDVSVSKICTTSRSATSAHVSRSGWRASFRRRARWVAHHRRGKNFGRLLGQGGERELTGLCFAVQSVWKVDTHLGHTRSVPPSRAVHVFLRA